MERGIPGLDVSLGSPWGFLRGLRDPCRYFPLLRRRPSVYPPEERDAQHNAHDASQLLVVPASAFSPGAHLWLDLGDVENIADVAS